MVKHKEEPAAAATKIDDKPFLQVLLPTKKKRRRENQSETRLLLRNEFAGGEGFAATANDDRYAEEIVRTEPLVIPVAPDQFQWKKQQLARIDDTSAIAASPEFKKEIPIDFLDEETAAAVRALQEEASSMTTAGGGRGGSDNGRSARVIASNVNTSIAALEEQQQYQHDLKALPAELEETAEAYQRVPIAEFGAALLRGMGWKDDEDGALKKKDQTKMSLAALPRPHRLGLGAIPAAAPPLDPTATRPRPRRSDRYQRDQAVQRQEDFYRAERQKQVAADRQRTLQNGSYVRLFDSTRARIVQLVGVPGLNQVQIQREGEAADSTVKRNAIDRLLTRQDLEAEAFQEADVVPAAKQSQKYGIASRKADRGAEQRASTEETRSSDRGDDHSRRRGDRNREDRRKRNETDDDGGGGGNGKALVDDGPKQRKPKTQQRQERPNVWVIPNIRVRVVTEKLGRRHYKEKGVVVDVTAAGTATVQMSSGTVLDRVPERYLETALPRVGGNVIVLRDDDGPHQFAKGRLLERDSRQGVLQVFEDMSCVQLPLDDLAEWCGALDDDLG